MFTTRPELAGTFGMVASTHWLASQAGMAVLEEGGNAFDAAVAAGFVLHVVEPHLNGPGGDMPLIFRRGDGPPTVLCGQGVAPAGATIDHYTSLGLRIVPGTGLLAAAVPGAVPAWLTLLRDHGTFRPSQVLRFAIDYAEGGHPVLPSVAATIGQLSGYFSTYWPTSAAQWLPAPAAGALLRLPTLAATYRRLSQEADAASGREAQCEAALAAWAQGFVAEIVDRFVRDPVHDSSGEPHAGVITADDLAGWRPAYEPPLSVSWRGHQVFKTAGWGQGPAFLHALALLDPLLREDGPLGEPELHRIVEALKLALADRDAWFGDLGDPALPGFLSEAYLAERRALVGEDASAELRPGRLGGHEPRLASAIRKASDRAASEGVGEPTLGTETPTGGDTCHLDVVDRWGNAVSATPSGGWLQSSPTIPDLGFCLGTRLQMTWLEPGLPSSLAPGRRPRTTLSPGMAIMSDGRTLAFGTPGGDQQEQWPMLFWLAHTITGLNLQEAVDAPSLHTTSLVSSFDPRVWTPAGLEMEGRHLEAVVAGLRQRGHRVIVRPDWSLGRISAASYDPNSRVLRAAANPRGMQGYAVGR